VIETNYEHVWPKNGYLVSLGLVTTGGPAEIYDWIAKCKKEFGEQPTDLEIGFEKD
jgi:hypothetical protein